MGRKSSFDPNKMKSTAEAIDQKLADFTRAKQNIDTIIRKLSQNWDDPSNQRYAFRYNTEAKAEAERAEKLLKDMASLFRQCAKRYGDAIDNGNDGLSK